MSSSKTIRLWQLFQTVSKSMFKIDSLFLKKCYKSIHYEWIDDVDVGAVNLSIGLDNRRQLKWLKLKMTPAVRLNANTIPRLRYRFLYTSYRFLGPDGGIYINIKTFKKTFKKPSFTVASDYRISPANQWFNDLRWYPIKDK